MGSQELMDLGLQRSPEVGPFKGPLKGQILGRQALAIAGIDVRARPQQKSSNVHVSADVKWRIACLAACMDVCARSDEQTC